MKNKHKLSPLAEKICEIAGGLYVWSYGEYKCDLQEIPHKNYVNLKARLEQLERLFRICEIDIENDFFDSDTQCPF